MVFKTKFDIGARVQFFNENKLSEPEILLGHVSKVLIQQDSLLCVRYCIQVESRIPVLVEPVKDEDCQHCNFFAWAYETALYDGLSSKQCREDAKNKLAILYETELDEANRAREPIAKALNSKSGELNQLDSRIADLTKKLETLNKLKGE